MKTENLHLSYKIEIKDFTKYKDNIHKIGEKRRKKINDCMISPSKLPT